MPRLAFTLLLLSCTFRPPGPTTAAAPPGEGRFGPVDTPAPPTPTAEELLRDAERGTFDGHETELSSRMQRRTLRFPKAPRGATARFNLDDGRRAWVTSLPSEALLNTPAYANGKVMLGGGFASHEMYALDAMTGEPSWTAPASDGGPSSPIVEGDKLLFNTESCELFVLEVATGKTLWHKFLGDPLMSQPAAADGLVFSAYPHDGGHRFGAYRIEDGQQVWSQPIGADVIAAPRIAGDSVYFATMDGGAERLERKTGRVLWRRDDVGAASAPNVAGDHVLLTRRVDQGEQPIVLATRDGSLVSHGDAARAPYFDGQSRDRNLARLQPGAWGTVPSGAHLGLDNVTMGWAFQGSTATVADGRAYSAVGGDIRARDIATGRIVWERTYADANGAQAVTPPAVVGGQMYFGTVDGHLYAVDEDTGMTAWSYDVGEPVAYQPIVAHGWLYATTAKGRVLGLEIGDPTLDGWHMWGGDAEHGGAIETSGPIDPSLLRATDRPGTGAMRRGNDELPLEGTEVHAEVRGIEARVTVVQHFHNGFEEPIEATYLFPLPDEAAVDAMEMHVGSRIVRAVVQRRAQAQQTYAEAKASGKHAALLEQQRPNLFAQRVANIAPGEKIDVRISYAQTLPFEDGHYDFVFPMTAHPAPPVALELDIDAGMPLTDVTSPTHGISTTRTAAGGAIVRVAPETKADHDLEVRYTTGGAAPRAAVVAHRERDSGYFTLLMQPPAADRQPPTQPRDLTLLLDTSSSMRGRPLDGARAVAERIVRGLGEHDTVQIVAFGDDVRRLPAVHATPEGIARAVAFLAEQHASGGTVMAPAIRAAFAETVEQPEHLRLAVLMTDGYLGNEHDVLAELARNLGSARLYSLGVGASPNRFLLDRAAEIGRGRTMVMRPSEDAARAAARFAAWIERPVFTDVSIDWGGLDVEDVYPRRIPDVFAGKPLVLAGRYHKGGLATVRVMGTYGGKRYERAVQVVLPSSEEPAHDAERVLWARAAVRDRMEAMTLREDPALIEQVTELGLRHHLVTPWTSLVAVEDVAASSADAVMDAGGVQAMLSPARTLPGDPEIRIAAPASARAVTVDLPFGETVAAHWDDEAGEWVARFLVPRDAEEGNHTVRVNITLADGKRELRRIGYVVDATPPKLAFTVQGTARPGALIVLRGTQVVKSATGIDARRVELKMADGVVFPMAQTARGTWEAKVRIPERASGTMHVRAYAVDVAANVGESDIAIEVRP